MLFVSNSDFKELKFFKKSSKELICTATLESLQLQRYYGITLLKNATTTKHRATCFQPQEVNGCDTSD